jgi:cytochrome c556
MKPWIYSALFCSGIAAALPAAAQFAKPEDAIKYRQSSMFLMNSHMGRLGAMVNGRVPFDAKAAADNAELLVVLSKLPFDAYGPGTDQGDTRAKPELWAEMDKFKAKAAKLQEDALKLSFAARGGHLVAIKAAYGETANSCKSCHDAYRKD